MVKGCASSEQLECSSGTKLMVHNRILRGLRPVFLKPNKSKRSAYVVET
ncbi:hypothetical protein NBRC111894_1856 [Sporolactobacillus inulinus]|uniref:Uncharacterized protein n=1 Tax=Sporolactobacillus inulinus TaxID=2078 RepID=A0A4Y1ZB45_9BACL|nr:hypothetical protein NBRC111894_1856 [Sporolactobacillus inulinus]